MRAFLRLFTEFITLEAELAEARAAVVATQEIYADTQQQNLRLQDRLDGAREDRGRLWDLLQASLQGERESYRAQINVHSQRAGAGIPWPESHHIAPEAVPRLDATPFGRGGRILPSEVQAKATRRSVEEIVGKLGG